MTTTSMGHSQGLGHGLRPTGKILPGHARAHNRSLVLQKLFQVGPSTRADLARTTALTRVTISDLIAQLMNEGIVEELGVRPGTFVGKPATLVGIRTDAFQIITIDLSDELKILGAVLDVTGRIIVRKAVPLEDRIGEAAYDQLVRLCRRLTKACTAPVLGIGIGSPGVVLNTGVIEEAPNMGWYQVPLATKLSEALGVPVSVANDANVAALGEYTFGGAGGTGTMVLTVGHGVGAGLVLDGALLQGHHQAAGEIGHVTVDDEGDLCACGRRGCLETILAVPALRAQIEGRDPEAADAILASVGRRLGVALAPVVSALNLSEVIFAGPPELLDGALREAVQETIMERTMAFVGESLDLRMATLGADVVLAGGAVLVLSSQLGVS